MVSFKSSVTRSSTPAPQAVKPASKQPTIASAVKAVQQTPTTTVSQKLKNVVTVRNLTALGLAAAAVGGIYNHQKLFDLALQVKEMFTSSQKTSSSLYDEVKLFARIL